MKKITLFIAILYSISAFSGTTYLVDNGSGTVWTTLTGPGGTVVHVNLSSPAQSFNAWFAATTLNSGDQVWIAKGTYYLTGVVTLKTGVAIYGSFAGTETSTTRATNSSDKWDFANPTVLDGSVAGTKTYIGLSGNSAAIIDGLTIQNCTNGATNTSGGGAKITGASTVMQNCIIASCTATAAVGTGASAGITIQGAATLKDSYIHDNISTSSSTCGGGITIYGNTCSVTGCKINTNSSNGVGGGIYIYSTSSGVSISSCNFTGNSSVTNGGAIGSYISNSTNTTAISISGCNFTTNTTSGSGGAIYLTFTGTYSNSTFNVSNCIFTSNYSTTGGGSSSAGGGAAAFAGVCTFSIDKCTFTNNYTTLAYGGAIEVSSALSGSITNSKFTGNTSGSTTTNNGAAIYTKIPLSLNNCVITGNTGINSVGIYAGTLASTFQNCTFASNVTSTATEAPILLSSVTPANTFTNCLFYKSSTFTTGTPTVTYSGFDITAPSGSGNISGITASSFKNAVGGEYSLGSGSAAIDAGTTIAACSPDIVNTSRPQGNGYDMGAYEATYVAVAASATNGTVSGATTKAVVGNSISLVATANAGYRFVNWTEGGSQVSTNATYTFTVSTARTLVANFAVSAVTLSTNALGGFSTSNSTEQSFTVSGTNLVGDVTITGTTNYEISTGTGGSFVATSPITLTQSGGTVSSSTIYVRLKSGLSASNYNEGITVASSGITTQTVGCSAIINAGFEVAASGYTVSESSLNVLYRVAGISDVKTQTTSPTWTNASPIDVTNGMWVKKAPSTAYIKGVVTSSDFHSGTSCLNLKIGNGTPNTGSDTWTNAIALQKLSLTNTQKYTVSFWAKIDPTASNVATVVTAFITDNTKGTNLSCAIPLTGGTTWTQYSATFDIPTFKASNATADFTTAFVGVGLTTTYDASTIKTNYSGVLLDDFSVTPTTASTVAVTTSAVGTGCVVTGGGVYTVGSSATVVASPNNGYKFVNWTLNTSGGAEQSTSPSYTFTVAAATILVANFVATGTTCTVSTTSLSGFTYINGNGPSAEQSFTVSGTNLLSNISIAAAADYQISLGSGVSFVSTNPISLNTGATVNTTTIYVRLKAGLAANNYSSNENITVSTLSLAYQSVVCSGSVSSNPVLTYATPTSVSKIYGDAVFTNAASSSLSAGAVTYVSANTAVATVDANSGQATIVGAGSSVITATIAANGIYGAATTSYTLNVAQKSLTITATGPIKTYGTALTAGTSATNFTTNGAEVSGETVSNVTLTPDAAGLSAATAAGVAYIVNPSLATGTGGFSASNYNITYTAYNGTVATTVPNAPTIGTATAGNAQAWVSFSAPSNNGGANITSYTVTSSPDGITGTGSTSPILVTALSDRAYTFSVTATNSAGTGAASAASNSATPNAGIVNVTSSTSVGSFDLTSGNDDVVVGSGALLTIDATTNIHSLTIAPGGQVTNTSSLTALSMTINSDGTNSGTGTYIDNGGTTTVATTKVNQALTSARNWYFSSPLSVSKAQTGYTFYSRDETNNAWTSMTTGNGTTTGDALNVGQGYIANLASGTATYSFSGGTLNTGNITTGSNGVPALSRTAIQAYAGYNLVGNPYPSYLDWVAVSGAATNVDPTMWYRTKNGSVYEFDTYNASSGVGTNNATVITQYIPPMQAFWVKVSSGTSGTLALTNTMRSHNDISTNKFRTKAVNNTNQSVLYLQVSNGVNSDEAIVLFNPNASNSLDAYDSPKMTNANPAIPEIYTTVSNESLVINGMNAIPYNTEIPLGFTTGQAGTNFSLKASQITNFPSGTKLILKDYQDINNPVINDLSDGSSYVFSSNATSNNSSRFALLFHAPSITTGINPTDKDSFWISTNANGQIILNGTPNTETSVEVYNAIGQRMAAKNLTSNINVLDTRLVPGVYSVVLRSPGKTANTKVIVN